MPAWRHLGECFIESAFARFIVPRFLLPVLALAPVPIVPWSMAPRPIPSAAIAPCAPTESRPIAAVGAAESCAIALGAMALPAIAECAGGDWDIAPAALWAAAGIAAMPLRIAARAAVRCQRR
jgi:hypothetical protein